MLSVSGIYDGKSVLLTSEFKEQKRYKVIVTFVEELSSTEAESIVLRDFGNNTTSFAFWNNPEEDLYQDYLELPGKQ